VLNAFGPWRTASESLALLGADGYTSFHFEGKLPIFRGGRPPNLDVVISDDGRVVAIESKLLEHLTGGQLAAFKPAYEKAIQTADDTWRSVYEKLKNAPNTFNYLDAAQLIRHYLGLKTQLGTA
jgi:Restriction Endonuclease associating with ARP